MSKTAKTTKKSAANGRGRPSTFDEAVAKRICERLAMGETLRGICMRRGMPGESTVRGWVVQDIEGFAAQYARARDMGLDTLADEILEIADDDTRDSYVDADGSRKRNNAAINRDRLRVDTRKWYLSKLAPKRYGQRVEVSSTALDPVIRVITGIEHGPNSKSIRSQN
jgi:hypothetical protein